VARIDELLQSHEASREAWQKYETDMSRLWGRIVRTVHAYLGIAGNRASAGKGATLRARSLDPAGRGRLLVHERGHALFGIELEIPPNAFFVQLSATRATGGAHVEHAGRFFRTNAAEGEDPGLQELCVSIVDELRALVGEAYALPGTKGNPIWKKPEQPTEPGLTYTSRGTLELVDQDASDA
jgi:hypothetical protein